MQTHAGVDPKGSAQVERALAFGRELQRERERRGISLDAIADGTKVAPRYLRALESDDVRNLPGGIFNKGFVRSYCRFLGLNEDDWLQRFARTAPAPADDADWAEFAENVKRTRIQTPPAMRRRWWGVAAMLLALGTTAWALWHYVLQNRLAREEIPVRAIQPAASPSYAPGGTLAAPGPVAHKLHRSLHSTASHKPLPSPPAEPQPSTTP